MSVVLGLHLAARGLQPAAIELAFTAALAGGAVMTGLLGIVADRLGRQRVLVVDAGLCLTFRGVPPPEERAASEQTAT